MPWSKYGMALLMQTIQIDTGVLLRTVHCIFSVGLTVFRCNRLGSMVPTIRSPRY